jgi:hypothetical protein
VVSVAGEIIGQRIVCDAIARNPDRGLVPEGHAGGTSAGESVRHLSDSGGAGQTME